MVYNKDIRCKGEGTLVRIVILLMITLVLFLGLRYVLRHQTFTNKQVFGLCLAILVGLLVAFLGITGKLNPVFAFFAAALPFITRLNPWLGRGIQAFGLFRKMRAMFRTRQAGSENRKVDNTLTTAQHAYEVLGLAPGATREEIIGAHRKLIQKIHPDRGGSNYLAARINEAKDYLLGQYKDRQNG